MADNRGQYDVLREPGTTDERGGRDVRHDAEGQGVPQLPAPDRLPDRTHHPHPALHPGQDHPRGPQPPARLRVSTTHPAHSKYHPVSSE